MSTTVVGKSMNSNLEILCEDTEPETVNIKKYQNITGRLGNALDSVEEGLDLTVLSAGTLHDRVLGAKVAIMAAFKLALGVDDYDDESKNMTTINHNTAEGQKIFSRRLTTIPSSKRSNSRNSKQSNKQNDQYSSQMSFNDFHAKRMGFTVEKEKANDSLSSFIPPDFKPMSDRNIIVSSKGVSDASRTQKRQFKRLQDDITIVLQKLVDSISKSSKKNTEVALFETSSEHRQPISEVIMPRDPEDEFDKSSPVLIYREAIVGGIDPDDKYDKGDQLQKPRYKCDSSTVFNRDMTTTSLTCSPTNGRLFPKLNRLSKSITIQDNTIVTSLSNDNGLNSACSPSSRRPSKYKEKSEERSVSPAASSMLGKECKLSPLLRPPNQSLSMHRTDQNEPISQENYDQLLTTLMVKITNQQNQITNMRAFCKRKDRAIDTMSITVQQDLLHLQRENMELRAQNAISTPQPQDFIRHNGSPRPTTSVRCRALSSPGDIDTTSNCQNSSIKSPVNLNDVNQSLASISSETTRTNRDEMKIFYHQQMRSAIEDAVKASQREYVTMFDFLKLFNGDNPDPKSQEEGLIRHLERHHREIITRQNIDHESQIHDKNREIELLNREIYDLLNNRKFEKLPYKPSSTYLAARLNAIRKMRRAEEGGDDDSDDIYISEGKQEDCKKQKIDEDILFLFSQLDNKDVRITALNDKVDTVEKSEREAQNGNLILLENERTLNNELSEKLVQREAEVAELHDQLMSLEEELINLKMRRPNRIITLEEMNEEVPLEVNNDTHKIEALTFELKCLQDKASEKATKKQVRWTKMVDRPLVLPEYNDKGRLISDPSGIVSGTTEWGDPDSSDEEDHKDIKLKVEGLRAAFMRETANLAKIAAVAKGKVKHLEKEMEKVKNENDDLTSYISMLKEDVEDASIERINLRKRLSVFFDEKQKTSLCVGTEMDVIDEELRDELADKLSAENDQVKRSSIDVSEPDFETVGSVMKGMKNTKKKIKKKEKNTTGFDANNSASQSILLSNAALTSHASPSSGSMDSITFETRRAFSPLNKSLSISIEKPVMKEIGVQVALPPLDDFSLIKNTNSYTGSVLESKSEERKESRVKSSSPLHTTNNNIQEEKRISRNRNKLSRMSPRLRSQEVQHKVDPIGELQNNVVHGENYTKIGRSTDRTNLINTVFANSRSMAMDSQLDTLCIKGKSAKGIHISDNFGISPLGDRIVTSHLIGCRENVDDTMSSSSWQRMTTSPSRGPQSYNDYRTSILRNGRRLPTNNKKLLNIGSEYVHSLIYNKCDLVNRKKNPIRLVREYPFMDDTEYRSYGRSSPILVSKSPSPSRDMTQKHTGDSKLQSSSKRTSGIICNLHLSLPTTVTNMPRIPIRTLLPMGNIKVIESLDNRVNNQTITSPPRVASRTSKDNGSKEEEEKTKPYINLTKVMETLNMS